MDQYEHNPIRWWETTHKVVSEVCSNLSADDKKRVKAFGITHQRETFAPFDINGKPLRNGILWLDGRATDSATEPWDQRTGWSDGYPSS